MYRGHSLPTVVLPRALICPLVLKHSHPFAPSSSAFTFHCFLGLFNLNPPFTSSLPFSPSSYWPFISPLFISSSVLLFPCFISLGLSRHLSLSVHLHLVIFLSFFFLTPTQSLCSRSPHFLSPSRSDISGEGVRLVVEVEGFDACVSLTRSMETAQL